MNTIKHTEDYDDVFNFKHETESSKVEKGKRRVLKLWVKMTIYLLVGLALEVGFMYLIVLAVINYGPSECEQAYGYNASDCRDGSWSTHPTVEHDSIYNSID